VKEVFMHETGKRMRRIKIQKERLTREWQRKHVERVNDENAERGAGKRR
jgi:hypothetical protein